MKIYKHKNKPLLAALMMTASCIFGAGDAKSQTAATLPNFTSLTMLQTLFKEEKRYNNILRKSNKNCIEGHIVPTQPLSALPDWRKNINNNSICSP